MRPTAFGPEFATDALSVAVEFGLLLAAFMFVKRMADETKVDATFELSEEEAKLQSQTGREVPKAVMICRLFGAFFFGAADKLETALMSARQLPEVLILRLREVVATDATGISALEDMESALARVRELLKKRSRRSAALLAFQRRRRW